MGIHPQIHNIYLQQQIIIVGWISSFISLENRDQSKTTQLNKGHACLIQVGCFVALAQPHYYDTFAFFLKIEKILGIGTAFSIGGIFSLGHLDFLGLLSIIFETGNCDACDHHYLFLAQIDLLDYLVFTVPSYSSREGSKILSSTLCNILF